MMDWADCRAYCQNYHTAQFADILDTDTMECLRYNMNQQYSPGNGYAGHYWAGGYKAEDGQYKWDSGEPLPTPAMIPSSTSLPGTTTSGISSRTRMTETMAASASTVPIWLKLVE